MRGRRVEVEPAEWRQLEIGQHRPELAEDRRLAALVGKHHMGGFDRDGLGQDSEDVSYPDEVRSQVEEHPAGTRVRVRGEGVVAVGDQDARAVPGRGECLEVLQGGAGRTSASRFLVLGEVIRAAGGSVRRPRRGHGAAARTHATQRPLLVEHGGDLRVVDVRLVVPVEAGVDRLRQLLALDGLDGRLDALLADADRVLGDRAGHQAAVDRVDLGLAGVEADDLDLALHAELLDRVDDADRRALVGAEDALEVRGWPG